MRPPKKNAPIRRRSVGYGLIPPMQRLSPPRRRPVPREEREQILLFDWARRYRLPPATDVEPGAVLADYLHAIPNGGARDAVTGARLKRAGVLAGVSDVFLPLARDGSYGLYIELKARGGASKPKASPAQSVWMYRMARAGYSALLCIGFDEAREAILDYLAKHDALGRIWRR